MCWLDWRLVDCFPDLAEVIADGYSRRKYKNGCPDTSYRVDRVLVNSRTSVLVGMPGCARYVSSLADPALPSDHSALEVRLSPPPRRTRCTISHWILEHPMFSALGAEAPRDFETNAEDSFADIQRMSVRSDARLVRMDGLLGLRGHFLEPTDSVRARTDEEQFAREVDQLYTAQVLGDMRGDLWGARTQEERRARAHRRLSQWRPSRRRTTARLWVAAFRRAALWPRTGGQLSLRAFPRARCITILALCAHA